MKALRVLLALLPLAFGIAHAQVKISALPAASTQVGSEVLPEYQAGQCLSTNGTCGVTTTQLKNYVIGSLSLGSFATQNYNTPPPIGATTPAAGSFTTLSSTGAAALNSATVGSPTGGALGAGTLNAQGVYVQGVPAVSYPQTPAELSVSVTPVNELYPAGNILRYGADPTGVADSSEAMNNAIKAALASGGTGYVYVPAGTFLISGAQILFGNNLSIIGANRAASVFNCNLGASVSCFRYSNNGTSSPAINTSGYARVTIQGITIETSISGSTAAALELSAEGYSYQEVSQIRVAGSFKYGLIIDGSEISHFENNIFDNTGPENSANIWLVSGPDRVTGQDQGFTNSVTIAKNQISGGVYGVVDDGGTDHSYLDNDFNSNAVAMRAADLTSFVLSASEIESTVQTGNANVDFESTTLSGASAGESSSGDITANYFGGDMAIVASGGDASLEFGGTGYNTGIRVSGNYFRFNLGPNTDIDVTHLGNSTVGPNYAEGNSGTFFYTGIHNDSYGNTLTPAQNGFPGINSAPVVGDSRYTTQFTGGLLVGSPTGGSEGPGTLNAQGVYVQGVPVPSYPQTAAEIAAGVTPVSYLYPAGNVLRYGCVGNNSTLNDTCISNSIAAAVASGGTGFVYFPAGIYKHASTITLQHNLIVRGDGNGVSSPGTPTSELLYTGSGDQILLSDPINSSTPANVSIRDMNLSSSVSTAGKANFDDVGSTFIYLYNDYLGGEPINLILDQSEIVTVRDCLFQGITGIGAWLVNGPDHTAGANVGYTNRITFVGDQFNGTSSSILVVDDGGTSHVFSGNDFNSGATQIRVSQVTGLSVAGNDMEGAATQIFDFEKTRNNGATSGATLSAHIDANSLSATSPTYISNFASGSVDQISFTDNSVAGTSVATNGLAAGVVNAWTSYGNFGSFMGAAGSYNISAVNGLELNSGLALMTTGATCSMSAATTCTATVPTGSVHCSAYAQGATAYYAACGISGTTATVTANASNSATWLVQATQ